MERIKPGLLAFRGTVSLHGAAFAVLAANAASSVYLLARARATPGDREGESVAY